MEEVKEECKEALKNTSSSNGELENSAQILISEQKDRTEFKPTTNEQKFLDE